MNMKFIKFFMFVATNMEENGNAFISADKIRSAFPDMTDDEILASIESLSSSNNFTIEVTTTYSGSEKHISFVRFSKVQA